MRVKSTINNIELNKKIDKNLMLSNKQLSKTCPTKATLVVCTLDACANGDIIR